MKYITSLLLIASFIVSTAFSGGPDFKVFPSKKLSKQFNKSYAYIPSGTLKIGEKEISVAGFFMYKTEITNLDYREFLADLERSGDTELLQQVQVAPENWEQDILAKTYHTHPAYEEYPVLNISHEAAKIYCKWLEKKLAENYKVDPGKIMVRLPVKEEWMHAAQAGHSFAPYPWGGYYLRNAKGCVLANFNKALGTENITYNQQSGEYEVVPEIINANILGPTPVKSYVSNDFGLFNMSGNVAEMIAESGTAMGGSWNSTGYDIRINSEYDYDAPNPYVGFRPIVTFLGQ